MGNGHLRTPLTRFQEDLKDLNNLGGFYFLCIPKTGRHWPTSVGALDRIASRDSGFGGRLKLPCSYR